MDRPIRPTPLPLVRPFRWSASWYLHRSHRATQNSETLPVVAMPTNCATNSSTNWSNDYWSLPIAEVPSQSDYNGKNKFTGIFLWRSAQIYHLPQPNTPTFRRTLHECPRQSLPYKVWPNTATFCTRSDGQRNSANRIDVCTSSIGPRPTELRRHALETAMPLECLPSACLRSCWKANRFVHMTEEKRIQINLRTWPHRQHPKRHDLWNT